MNVKIGTLINDSKLGGQVDVFTEKNDVVSATNNLCNMKKQSRVYIGESDSKWFVIMGPGEDD